MVKKAKGNKEKKKRKSPQLIRINERPDAREIQSKGGSRKTYKKKLAARLRIIDRYGLTKQRLQNLKDFIKDHDNAIMDTKIFLDWIRAKMMREKNPGKDFIPLVREQRELIKQIYGERIKIEQSTEINLKIKRDIDDFFIDMKPVKEIKQ